LHIKGIADIETGAFFNKDVYYGVGTKISSITKIFRVYTYGINRLKIKKKSKPKYFGNLHANRSPHYKGKTLGYTQKL
jgi:hypothetical protein